MTKLLAQHGAAKGRKITEGLSTAGLDGAIFSPNDEKLSSIIDYVLSTEGLNKSNTFLDPQFYFSVYDEGLLKKLGELQTYPSNIARRDWRKKSDSIMDYINEHSINSRNISNTLITPGFYIDNVDWHFDYSIDIYNHCLENFGFDHYALSLLVDYSFFSNKTNVDEFIEEINDTVSEKDYIYLTFCYENKSESNYEEMDSSNLGNMLYTIYRLNQAGFKIILGYTFMNSILFSILDCEFVSSGWFNTLRKFQKTKFDLSPTFGRRKQRYTSVPLLSYITFEDLQTIVNTPGIEYDDVLSGSSYDTRLIESSESLSFVDLEQQYWESISKGVLMISEATTIEERIVNMRTAINNAIQLYKKAIDVLNENDELESAKRLKNASKHLVTWLDAIDIFQATAVII